MLIKFTVENFLSFKDKTVFEMIASEDENHPEHIINIDFKEQFNILKMSAIYGANAAGKSNFVKAIMIARDIICKGTKLLESITVMPYLLKNNPWENPIKFEFCILIDKFIYTYGFKVKYGMIENNQMNFVNNFIQEEWLHREDSQGKVRSVYERESNELGEVKVDISPLIARKKTKEYNFIDYVCKGTRSNQLFLTEAFSKNVEFVKPLFMWFYNNLIIISQNSSFVNYFSTAEKDANFIGFISKFINNADTGISELRIKKQDISKEPVDLPLKSFVDSNRSRFAIKDSGIEGSKELLALEAVHKNINGEVFNLSLLFESDGTNRFIDLLPVIYFAQKGQHTIIIDELDLRLHPLLSKLFIEKFASLTKNSGSQIIFTTHDTHLLDLEILRKDEIWFAEKDKNSSTHIYSLLNIKYDEMINIEKGYLYGRFGAIPFINNIDKIGME